MALDRDPNYIFRDFVTDGVPSSGSNNPRKVEIRQLLSEWWQTLIGLVAQQSGITLPNLLIRYTITGGNENAISATPNLTPPAGAGVSLFSIIIKEPNTGNVTINGKRLLTSAGSEIVAGGLTPGAWLFLDAGDTFRLLSDQASAALVAAAEAAAALAKQYRDECLALADGAIPGTALTSADNLNNLGQMFRSVDWVGPAVPANAPPGFSNGFVMQAAAPTSSGGSAQIAVQRPGAAVSVRTKHSNAWSDWKELATKEYVDSKTVGGVSKSAAYANMRALSPVDGDTTIVVDRMRGGIFIFDDSDLSAEVSADPEEGVYVAPAGDTTGASGAWIRLYDGPVHARWFGLVGGGTAVAVANSVALQAAIDFAISQGIGTVRIHSGDFSFDAQIVVTGGPGVNVSLDIRGCGRRTTLRSQVIGQATSTGTSGFLFLIKGLRHSKWSNFLLDYSYWSSDTVNNAGAGGIVLVPLDADCFENTFEAIRFIGGTDKTHRELNKTRSLKIIGNMAGSFDPGDAAYFNRVKNCSFNIAYKHLEYIQGTGDASTRDPNGNMSDNCLFERYIIGIDPTTCMEHRHTNHFFQQGQGVVGVNGGWTECVKSNGFGNVFSFTAEPGPGSRPYLIGSNATKTQIIMINNCGAAGSDVSTLDNFILDRSTIIDQTTP